MKRLSSLVIILSLTCGCSSGPVEKEAVQDKNERIEKSRQEYEYALNALKKSPTQENTGKLLGFADKSPVNFNAFLKQTSIENRYGDVLLSNGNTLEGVFLLMCFEKEGRGVIRLKTVKGIYIDLEPGKVEVFTLKDASGALVNTELKPLKPEAEKGPEYHILEGEPKHKLKMKMVKESREGSREDFTIIEEEEDEDFPVIIE